MDTDSYGFPELHVFRSITMSANNRNSLLFLSARVQFVKKKYKMRLISVMRMLLFISMIYESTHETYFQIQKGTYSKIQLCKNSTPFYETSARSIIECFSFCLILLGNKCKNFNYRWKERNCSIYQDVIRYDYVGFPKKDCSGYQLINS